MQIVIDIPEEIHRHTQEYEVGGFNRENDTKLFMAIKNGTPLPKGHGRLIDADDIDNHIIGHVDTRSCPTIIEADGGGRMLREEAIAFFKDMNECTYGNLEAVEMAIEALEQEPCGDVVSRQAAINAAIDGADKWDGGFNREREKRIREEIERLPSVTAQQKMGKWISNAEDDLKISEYTCSNCKGLSDEDSDFCPKCGCKMREVEG